MSLSSCLSWSVDYAGPWEKEPLTPIIKKSELNSGLYAIIKTGDEPSVFWSRMASPANLEKYKASGGKTKCNIFLGDMIIRYLGKTVYCKIFPRGMKSPKILFEDWKRNPNLVRLYPQEFSIKDIQELADSGYVILLAYRNRFGPDHIGFIGNIDLQLKTIPPLSGLEGRPGSSLDPKWLPLVVQAGTYSGISSMVYASNGWLRKNLFKSGTVCYYLIKV